MASLHKSKAHKQAHDLWKFCVSYYALSIVATVGFVLYAYKDILLLRFRSEFFSGSYESSDQLGQLFFEGFSTNLLRRFFEYLPVAALVLLIILVAYSLVNTYKKTYHSLLVHKYYINASKESAITIALHYTVTFATAFAVPVLYWCFYLVAWFPQMARLPLKYIFGSSPWQLAGISLLVLFVLTLTTQVGLVLTRLAIRLFKV